MTKNNFNPFNPNSVVVPNLFAGRSQNVIDISKKLSQLEHNMPTSFFIHGERGIGKTALAKLIKSIAVLDDPDLYNLNLLTSYYSVEGGQDLGSVLQASVNNLTDQMDNSLVQEIGGHLGDLFKNGKFTIGAFGASVDLSLSETAAQRDITIKDQTVSILSNLLKAMREKQSKDGILIIIDEIHNLNNLQGAASVFRNIVTTLDVGGIGQVSFLLLGYDEDVERFFSEDSSARRVFDLYPLDVMPPNEAAEVLRKGFQKADYTWEESALEDKIKSAGGYPHSIQVLGHNLVETDSDGNIDSADWEGAIVKSAQALQTKEFSKMYSFGKPLTEKDKILIAMALADEGMTRKEISEKSTSTNVYKEIASLKSLGAVKEDENKALSLHSQLFRTAILFDYYLRLPTKGK
jgi:hypothetical protein